MPNRSTHKGTAAKGKFIPDNPLAFKTAFCAHEGKRVVLSIARETKKRTNPQNAYLWGVCYKLIADHIGESTETVHDLMRHKFHYKILSIKGKDFRLLRTTTKMTTVDFNLYVEQIQQWASEFLGVYIPDANEIPIEYYKEGY